MVEHYATSAVIYQYSGHGKSSEGFKSLHWTVSDRNDSIDLMFG